MGETREILSGMILGGSAVFAILATFGKFLWSYFDKSKDAQITVMQARITDLKDHLDAANKRIATLEQLVWMVAPPSIRPVVMSRLEGNDDGQHA